MASGAEIAGGAAAGASLIPALIGKGKNERTASGWGPGQAGYDANAGFFGGDQNGLQNYRNQVTGQRGATDARGAFQADYGNANRFQDLSLGARGGQQDVANMMLARARGQVPSIADQQAQRDISRLNASTASAAASARGPGAISLAQQNAMGARAGGAANISSAAQIAAAQERERAEANALGAFSTIRGGDQGSQQIAGQQAQFQTTMQQGNRDANDRRAMGYDQLDYQAQRDAMQGRLQQQQILSQSHSAAEQANQRTSDQNAQNKGLIDTIGDLSDSRAKYMLSDFDGKIPLMGMSPSGISQQTSMAGTGPATFDVINPGGGMDVLGSLQAHGAAGTKYTNDPTGGMAGGMMMSDAKAKQDAFEEGVLYSDATAAGHDPTKYVPDYMKRRRTEPNKVGSEAKRPLIIERRAGHPVQADPEPQTTDDVMVRPGSFGAPASAPQTPTSAQGGLSPSYFDAPQSTAPAAPAPQPAQSSGVLSRVSQFFRSDVHAKEQARMQGRAEGAALAGKPRLGPSPGAQTFEPAGPGQAQFVPGRGWVQAGADERAAKDGELDNAIGQTVAQDTEASEKADQARQGNNLIEAEKIRRGFSNDEEARKIRAGFAKDEQERAAGQPSWLDALGGAAKNLNEAQFGKTTSDERAKTKLGPSHAPLADAARKMEGQAYAYKPEFTPPEQEPGEVNYGFMAQNLEKNPITATTVKEGPDGMKRVDAQKLIKVLASTVSDQQKQIDETRVALAGKRRKAA